MKNNFAYFIASYGKPDNIPTYNCLKKLNARYPIYIVIGVDDPKYNEYIKNWPNNLVIFDKKDFGLLFLWSNISFFKIIMLRNFIINMQTMKLFMIILS